MWRGHVGLQRGGSRSPGVDRAPFPPSPVRSPGLPCGGRRWARCPRGRRGSAGRGGGRRRVRRREPLPAAGGEVLRQRRASGGPCALCAPPTEHPPSPPRPGSPPGHGGGAQPPGARRPPPLRCHRELRAQPGAGPPQPGEVRSQWLVRRDETGGGNGRGRGTRRWWGQGWGSPDGAPDPSSGPSLPGPGGSGCCPGVTRSIPPPPRGCGEAVGTCRGTPVD